MKVDTLRDLIAAENITMKFGDFIAVDGLSVSVKEGEIFGFLGPNGAGKTTTIRMLTTLLHSTSGKVTIGGHPIPEESGEAKKLIGIIQQHVSLDRDISVRENIKYHAILHKLPKAEMESRIIELSTLLGLDRYLDRTVVTLSGGWKRKVAIVCSIIHRPAILFLDEPTAGLDAQSRHMLWTLIRQLNNDGTTIFLTTHYIEEAEALCNRVGIINHGKIIVSGSPADLCGKLGPIAVEYLDNDKIANHRYFSERNAANNFIQSLPSDKAVTMRSTNLEDVFLELTGRKVDDL